MLSARERRPHVRRIFEAIRRLLDALLPREPSDADFAATEVEAAARRKSLRLRLREKGGRGGDR
jgi:hypothetical protein